ncbi:MAG: hypothetical protein AB3N14_14395, partial [Flavobacteriaceae bacterium]
QLLHILISTAAVWVFLKHAPFQRTIKILFIFGYFMLFEYTLISRNYALGVLFLFLACSMYETRRERFVLFSLFLALTCNTHAIFFVISCSLMFVTLIEVGLRDGLSFKANLITGTLIFAVGSLLAIAQMIPPSDTGFFEGINTISLYDRITKSVVGFFKGIVVLPKLNTIHFWNTNLLISYNGALAGVLAAFSLFIPYFLFF